MSASIIHVVHVWESMPHDEHHLQPHQTCTLCWATFAHWLRTAQRACKVGVLVPTITSHPRRAQAVSTDGHYTCLKSMLKPASRFRRSPKLRSEVKVSSVYKLSKTLGTGGKISERWTSC